MVPPRKITSRPPSSPVLRSKRSKEVSKSPMWPLQRFSNRVNHSFEKCSAVVRLKSRKLMADRRGLLEFNPFANRCSYGIFL